MYVCAVITQQHVTLQPSREFLVEVEVGELALAVRAEAAVAVVVHYVVPMHLAPLERERRHRHDATRRGRHEHVREESGQHEVA